MALRRRWRWWPRVQPEPAHFAYSRWDGSQTGFGLDADQLFDELADDLLYHGDLASALRRLHGRRVPRPLGPEPDRPARDAGSAYGSAAARCWSSTT